MNIYEKMTKGELQREEEKLREKYKQYQARNLHLDMSRGKPSPEQLDLSLQMLADGDSRSWKSENGTDVRNYGQLDGIPEARRLLGEILGCPAEQVIVGGSSSLTMMYDTLVRAVLFGIGGYTPWKDLPEVKFLCPVPGYDRHFRMTEALGIRMIPVPMTDEGPDMYAVEQLAEEDASIKGIWCVPRFSNPGGTVYSDETVRRLASFHAAAPDFRLFWDNAYALHALYDDAPQAANIFKACERAGNPDRVYAFASTAKMTFPGAGISGFASSPENIAECRRHLSAQAISYDKMNMLRHVTFLQDCEHMCAHMSRQAELLRPKFEAVEQILERELGGLGIARWNKPRGGYFISFYTLPGCAKAVVARCREAGVVLTEAGAAYPYGIDPADSHIRLAPSYPEIGDLKTAAELFAHCVRLVSAEKQNRMMQQQQPV